MSDSYNHVFKQSVNAFHRELISGGSSGGEGALVGALGSIVGIGTDIGGSIRIPANLQGLYGLQPSTRRIPYEKSGCVLDCGYESVTLTANPPAGRESTSYLA